jgi:threonine/homoserine/homoserine lactone efflux protein
MNTILGIILLAGGFFLAYMGYDKLQNSKAGIKIGEVEISASDSGSQRNGYLLIGGGVVCVLAGAIVLAKKKK